MGRLMIHIALIVIIVTVAMVGASQLFNNVAEACPSPCSSTECQCWWSSSGEGLEDQCYSRVPQQECKPCIGCATICAQYCIQFTTPIDCRTSGPDDCDPY